MNTLAYLRPVSRLGQAWLPGLLLASLFVGLALPMVGFARWCALALSFPFGVDYGEGIVWEQTIRLIEGRAFGTIDSVPGIVFHYTPLYNLVTAILVEGGLDPLWAGRFISLAATLLTAFLLVIITKQLFSMAKGSQWDWWCAALAGFLFLHFYTVMNWAPLMRVDPLAVFFTTAGLLCGLLSLSRPRMVYLAAVLFVAAVYTKQTSVVAPAAVFGTLFFAARPVAIRGILASVVFGLALLAIAMLLTDGRFLTHVIGYNVNRFSWSNFVANYGLARWQLDAFALVFAGVAAALLTFRFFFRRDRADWRAGAPLIMLLVFLALKTLSLVSLAKSGASANYLVEWLVPISIIAALGVRESVLILADASERAILKKSLAFLGVAALALGQFIRPSPPAPNFDIVAKIEIQQQVMDLMKLCPNMVIGDDMVTIIRGGKRVVWEPAIFAELASLGRYDEGPILNALRTRQICMAIMRNDQELMRARYTPAVLDQIRESLPRRRDVGPWLVYF